jgi:uncharacterized membrane protein YhaH (DUF805 family)
LAVITPFTFEGRIGRAPYAAWSIALFASQYLVVIVGAGYSAELLTTDRWLLLVPHRALLTPSSGTWTLLQMLGLAYLLLLAWALAALAFRRAVDANVNEGIAGFAIAPVIQIPIILFLCFAPSKVAPETRTIAGHAGLLKEVSLWPAAFLGIFAGVGLTLVAVAVGTLIFGIYGNGLFLLTPFVIGVITAYIANRNADIGFWETALTVVVALAVASLAVVAAALEGLICIIMAAPLGFCMALIGGALGRAMALLKRRPARQPWQCIALLPLMFSVENVLPPSAHFDAEQTIVVAAPPDVVWQSMLSTDPVEGPLALPFRLGVAYPLRGEVVGEGVGALRYGEFSTGTAIERLTEWKPNRKLAFVVVRDIPGMRELSPYEHVHAPHVIGYFRTISTSFELVPRSDGGTEILERSSHELRLDPVSYWLPMAQWIVRENNARVLAHIRTHAERGYRALNAHTSVFPSP